jgi:hypothetical protein
MLTKQQEKAMNSKMKNKTKQISEGLEYEDLKGLVGSQISIDQYKPKIGAVEETVVVAFTVTYEDPAKDLSSFIETGAIEHLDVEASPAPDKDGDYKVFVEFTRDHNLFEKVEALLNSVDQITSKDDNNWQYVAYKVKEPQEFNEENFQRDIVDSAVKYRMTFLQGNNTAVTESLQRLQQLVKY